MKNGDVGAGASAKALPTSYPLQIRFIAADIAHLSRWTGCLTHAAYVSANVIAAPSRGPPLHVPLDFRIVSPVNGSSLST
jgi:hypothetical protein